METSPLHIFLDAPETMLNGRRNSALDAIVRALSSLPAFHVRALARLEPSTKNLLIEYLNRNLGMDGEFEHLLARLRQSLLSEVAAGSAFDDFAVDLLCSLGAYCFAREYVFAQTSGEIAQVNELRLDGGILHVAAIACYRPLPESFLENAALMSGQTLPGQYSRLLRTQITEPQEERHLAAEIRSFGTIEDEVSMRVREMYEANPYPRWTNVRWPHAHDNAARILVAGCGSGRHAIETAMGNPASEVLAVDLSRTSLAYGMRKAREYGIHNLTFMHGDLLRLDPSLGPFDHISCVGVLHHMKSPEDGLKALRAVLSNSGILEIGLYSNAARRDVVFARTLREQQNLPATADGVRALRQMIYAAPPNSPLKSIARSGDFYSLSECRDLLFHVQELRFDLPDVIDLLARTGFELQSLNLPLPAIEKFRQRFPEGNEKSLSDWSKYEAKYPDTFGAMYLLDARKA